MVWPFLRHPDKLWVQCLSQKYIRTHTFHTCNAKQTDSPFWKAFIQSRDNVLGHIRWVVGDGRSIDIFRDRWIPGVLSLPSATISSTLPVSYLINQDIQLAQ